MAWLEPVSLKGPYARLEPLSQGQCEGLTEAVKDGELWKLWYTTVPRAEDMRKEIDRRLGLQAAGTMMPWTVFDADGTISGMTTYMNVDAAKPARRDRLDLVMQARAAQRGQYPVQIAAADACLRKARLYCG